MMERPKEERLVVPEIKRVSIVFKMGQGEVISMGVNLGRKDANIY